MHSDTFVRKENWLADLISYFGNDENIVCVGSGKIELTPTWRIVLKKATDLKTLRDEEAVHGAISGKDWQAILGGGSPIIKLGMKGISDFAAWCPDILKETSKFLERCYQQM